MYLDMHTTSYVQVSKMDGFPLYTHIITVHYVCLCYQQFTYFDMYTQGKRKRVHVVTTPFPVVQ